MRKMEQVDRERYEVLRKMLQDRGNEIAEKMRSLRESLPDELAEVKDPEEQCADEFVRGLDFALIEMKSQTLARINEALRRLEGGTYGQCVDCDGPIQASRMQALPFAERCRECQRSREEIAAEAAKQQSRFGMGITEEPALPADRRPGRRAAVAAPGGRPVAPAARLARPGRFELRRQVAGLERASTHRPVEVTRTSQPSPLAAAPRRQPHRAGAAARSARTGRATKNA